MLVVLLGTTSSLFKSVLTICGINNGKLISHIVVRHKNSGAKFHNELKGADTMFGMKKTKFSNSRIGVTKNIVNGQ